MLLKNNCFSVLQLLKNMKPLLKLNSNLDQSLKRFLNEERGLFVYRSCSKQSTRAKDLDIYTSLTIPGDPLRLLKFRQVTW